ncbi:hypothetical protein GUJ93_ZPchr0001g30075 [Zizania palustris]|uniref:Late embryogenesis abundant protein LEA-2 subgroup domain-containing protein n=1 Tax=Zizania palustris TaxID=103762 RepID=A0A8J5V275_ZIZPA|nr:hypothetical protein GUJ93_ZPchr0001g30075 [Zizania palustris]
MANREHKVDHLDHPYYGPPIPPVEPHGGAAAGGRRCVVVANPYALCRRAFRVLTLALIAVCVVALVLWLVYQPTALKAYVDSAELTRFDLVLDGGRQQLRYNLTVAVTIRNPNREHAVLYQRLEAVALYGGERFGYVDLPRARQARKSTMVIKPSFRGQGVVLTDTAAFGREKEEGFFNINVKLHTRIRLKGIVVHSAEHRTDVDCYIRVPDPTNATAVALGFTPVQCHVDDF